MQIENLEVSNHRGLMMDTKFIDEDNNGEEDGFNIDGNNIMQ